MRRKPKDEIPVDGDEIGQVEGADHNPLEALVLQDVRGTRRVPEGCRRPGALGNRKP